MTKRIFYLGLGLVGLGLVVVGTPLGVQAQQTIRNITILAMPADATELPTPAALADNTANPTVPGVASFSMCWDGANWDRCAGAGGTDTELPAAAALADNTANPTVPGVASFLMCYDGSTWDRCPSSDGGVGASSTNTTRIVPAQTSIFRSIDLDETEEDVKTSAGEVCSVWVTNTSTGTRWVKFYNATAASVTVGTTTPVITIGIPGNSSDDVSGSLATNNGCLAFSTAISAAATTGVADADTGAPGANDVVVMVGYR